LLGDGSALAERRCRWSLRCGCGCGGLLTAASTTASTARSRNVVPGNAQRGVPERVPPMLVDHVLRHVDAEARERVRLIVRHAPDTCRHAIFRREVLPEHRPLSTALSHR